MTPSFAVQPTSHYERLSVKLQKSDRDFEATEASAVMANTGFPWADGASATTSWTSQCCLAIVASGGRTRTRKARNRAGKRPIGARFEDTPHGLTIRNPGNRQVPYFLCC